MDGRIKKRRILHVLNSSRFSGAEHVVVDIIKFMKEEDCWYVSRKGSIEEVLKKNNIHYYLVDKLNLKILSDIIKEIRPDIIHAHDFTASVCAVLTFSGKPVISHIHCNAPWMKKIGIRSIIYAGASIFYKNILVVSKAVQEEFIFRTLIKKKICVIGNPVNVKFIRKRAEKKMLGQSWDIVFVGRLSEAKNLPLLLDILEALLKRIESYSVVIVGEGEEEDYFRKEIVYRKLEKYVTYMGFLENPYLVMKSSKILLLPSKWEGFGLVAVEALALGKPVVCSGVGGLDEIVDDTCGKKCGFDVIKYVDEIQRLLEDKEYYKKKKEGAELRAMEMDNFDIYIRQVKDIYDVCESSTRRHINKFKKAICNRK